MRKAFSPTFAGLALAALAVLAHAQAVNAQPPSAQPAPPAPSFGPCAWARLHPADQDSLLSAYDTSPQSAMAMLGTEDAQVQVLVASCTHRTDVPPLWASGLMASQVIQNGAAAALLSARHLTRAALDAAWTHAPDDARQCVRANASKTFGVNSPPCPDPKAPLELLQALNISIATDRPIAAQALYYFNAKAQGEWGDALIAKLLTEPPRP